MREGEQMLIQRGNLNETPEHYELKQISKYILWSKGCRMIATEVYGFYGNHLDYIDSKFKHKNIIDTVGVDFTKLRNKSPKVRMIGIEAKASLSDFRNGFCSACELTYIIAPAGVIPVSEIPDKIGLIEVNLNNYSILPDGTITKGITTICQARHRLCSRFNNNEEYMDWTSKQLPRIAYRMSAVDLYKKQEIVFDMSQ